MEKEVDKGLSGGTATYLYYCIQNLYSVDIGNKKCLMISV